MRSARSKSVLGRFRVIREIGASWNTARCPSTCVQSIGSFPNNMCLRAQSHKSVTYNIAIHHTSPGLSLVCILNCCGCQIYLEASDPHKQASSQIASLTDHLDQALQRGKKKTVHYHTVTLIYSSSNSPLETESPRLHPHHCEAPSCPQHRCRLAAPTQYERPGFVGTASVGRL